MHAARALTGTQQCKAAKGVDVNNKGQIEHHTLLAAINLYILWVILLGVNVFQSRGMETCSGE